MGSPYDPWQSHFVKSSFCFHGSFRLFLPGVRDRCSPRVLWPLTFQLLMSVPSSLSRAAWTTRRCYCVLSLPLEFLYAAGGLSFMEIGKVGLKPWGETTGPVHGSSYLGPPLVSLARPTFPLLQLLLRTNLSDMQISPAGHSGAPVFPLAPLGFSLEHPGTPCLLSFQ